MRQNSFHRELPPPLCPSQPISALAPMQDITTLPFIKIVTQCGPPDYFFTEYFRVHEHSSLEKHILTSITQNPSDRPIFAQLIGENLFHLKRTVKELLNFPIAGIDLNMGCPAPKVYKKNVGGGLLRDPHKVDSILGHLRDAIPGLFTVKMRIGFDDTQHFSTLLDLINKHAIDLLSLHARTVKEMYRSEVHYEFIKQATQSLHCPVLANGNITSVNKAVEILNDTQAHGIMIGRSTIRNPWIFLQIRQHFAHQPIFQPKLRDVFLYIQNLYNATNTPDLSEKFQVNRMKKFLNFIGQSVDPEGKFLHAIRRAQNTIDFFKICQQFLLDNNKESQDFPTEPYQGVIARPNCETPAQTCSL